MPEKGDKRSEPRRGLKEGDIERGKKVGKVWLSSYPGKKAQERSSYEGSAWVDERGAAEGSGNWNWRKRVRTKTR